MMRFVVTTNGYALCQSKEMRDFVLTHRHNLKLSVSISALKQKFGNEFLTKAAPVIDLLKANGGDIHFVVDNPEDERVYEEIIYLYEQNVPVVRVSSARHWDLVRDKWPQYLDLFKRISDYLYFSGEPKFGRSQWDAVFRNNIYRFYKGIPLKPTPPTFCGCGYMYLAVDKQGDIYPCDFFANFPEFKIGDIYSGINETAILFKRMSEWIEDLYEGCKGCEVVPNGDIRLCPRAMCLAENYMVTGNPLLPAKNHCWANRIEFGNYSYIAQRAIKEGIDKVFLR